MGKFSSFCFSVMKLIVRVISLKCSNYPKSWHSDEPIANVAEHICYERTEGVVNFVTYLPHEFRTVIMDSNRGEYTICNWIPLNHKVTDAQACLEIRQLHNCLELRWTWHSNSCKRVTQLELVRSHFRYIVLVSQNWHHMCVCDYDCATIF